ncbi:hypothetical protein [Avibacterium paragallinarum]|uniref:hypothetical protein n=1 Tax=Avibacterium paragallinarum TaxID=728 RepID=UPI0039797788
MRKIIIFLIILCYSVAFSKAEENYPSDSLSIASETYGYYIGQNYFLDNIVRLHPELKTHADIAKTKFNIEFGDSIDNLKKILSEYNPYTLTYIQESVLKSLNPILSNNITIKESERFIDEVISRAKGNIDSPILENLLSYNPRYIDKPELEFLDGYIYKYKSNKHPKAKGIEFELQIPKSWKDKEGSRPNVVHKFINKNGKGYVIYMVIIKDFPYGKVTKLDIQELLEDKNSLASFLGGYGGIVTDSGELVLENQIGFWVMGKISTQRMMNRVDAEVISYNFFYKNKLISLSGFVTSKINNETIQIEPMKKYKPIFDLITNTFILTQKYK